MKIAEIFYSIQGEGILVGTPSVFVRSSGCNLRCVWCDTPYTSWAPEGKEMSVDEILASVNQYPAFHAVVTGGEPMIMPEIVPLTGRLRDAGLHVTIETAGTVFAPVACDLMSISPKLSNSTPRQPEGGKWEAQHERLRIQPEALRRLMSLCEYQLKFVVAAPGDLHEIEELLVMLKPDRSRVVLMPEGTDRETLRQRSLWLTDICKQQGFRYSPRLHIELYGNRRGV